MEVVDRIQNGLGLSFADAGRLLTVSEAAERMGLSGRTLRRLVQQRRIRHLRIGRLIRISAWDLDDFVANSTVSPIENSVAGTDGYLGTKDGYLGRERPQEAGDSPEPSNKAAAARKRGRDYTHGGRLSR